MDDFKAQLAIWGWAVQGHDDLATFTAECPARGKDYGWWDQTARDLDRQALVTPSGYQPVPRHWALPGVAALRMRSVGRP